MSPSIDYINGQLHAYARVNGKTNEGFEFYFRDMKQPLYGWDLGYVDTSIQTCFEEQQVELLKKYKKPVPDDLNITFRESSWEQLFEQLDTMLFAFLNAKTGYLLEDRGDNFNLSSENYRKSVAEGMVKDIQTITDANTILLADVPHEYFQGSRFLFESSDAYYELRAGVFF